MREIEFMDKIHEIEKVFCKITQKGCLSSSEKEDVKGFLERGKLLHKALNTMDKPIFMTDRDGIITWANEAFCEVTGYSKEEIIGKNPRILKSGKQDSDFYKHMWETILQGKVLKTEIINKNKYGELYVQKVTITPITDESNKVTSFISILEDITYLKELEKELKIKDRILDTYFSVSTLILMEIDLKGRIIAINPKGCETFGYTAENMIGENWLDFVFGDEKEEVKKLLEDLRNLGSSKKLEQNIVTKSGERKTILWNMAVINEKKEDSKVILVGEDVTKEKIEEKILETLSNKKSFEALQSVMRVLKDFIPFEKASLLISTKEKEYTEFPQYISSEMGNDESNSINKGLTIENGILIDQKIMSDDLTYIQDARKCQLKLTGMSSFENMNSMIFISLIVNEKMRAILYFGNRKSHAFSEEHLNIVKKLKNILASTVEKWYLALKVEKLTVFESFNILANRKHFLNILEEEIALSRRTGIPLSITMVGVSDIAYLKGKKKRNFEGAILKKVLEKVKRNLRKSDFVFVTSKSEFLIFLPGSNANEAKHFVKRIADFVDKEKNIAINFGIAQLEDDEDETSLLEKAKLALYESKIRKQTVYVHISRSKKYEKDCKIFNEKMKNALEKGEFVLYFQPVVELQSGKVVSAEALIRWRHNEKILSPNFFIPFAEESGSITQIDEWVLNKACEYIRKWEKRGYNLPISVNIAAPTMRKKDFVSRVQGILNKNNVEPNKITIELLERVAMAGKEVEKNIKELASLNVRIALDDFGTGYSNMNYLMLFPISTLKIDMSFVQNMLEDEKYEISLQVIISLGKRLGLKVIAEGVENEKQVKLLKALGCDAVQGFYFGKPVSALKFEEILKKGILYEEIV